ncbi:trypsin-like serine protease [Kitasatospora sp. NPDC127121]|uniref:trypsin-like serine protease n=1 Tax=Kitasatospora sp. NPDC127121 TaxID=3345371 RepID=UPI00363201FA
MRTVRRLAWPLGAALAIPVLAAPIPATAADAAPPSTVEGFAYPDAAKVYTDRNITLKSGDGHIVLADCASGPGLVHVLSRAANPSEVCFRITGPTGYLAVEIPKVYDIRGDDHSVKATLNTAGNVTSFDVPKNVWTPVGESVGEATTLLELTSVDGPAAPTASGDFPAVGTVTFGQSGRADARSCTATLVDRNWVLTAASCFGDSPAEGAPKTASTATIGGQSVGIAELVARGDRDLVMARLASPIDGVTPAALATGAPAAGESLRVPGYGRTATEWAPFKVHTTTHTVGAVATTTAETAPAAGQAPVCQGDAGAPLLREANGTAEIAAVASLSWQGGCLGTPATETRTGATSTRVDDVGGWVKELRFRTADVQAGTHVQIIGSDNTLSESIADYNVGRWTRTWTPMGNSQLLKVDSVAIGDTVHVYAVAGDGHVYGRDGKVGGSWGKWSEVPGGAADVKDISATARGNLVDLVIVGGDGSLYATTGDYNAGTWRPQWDKIGDNHLKAVTSAFYDNTTYIFAINEDDKVYTRSADYTAGRWTDWVDLPGSLPNVKAISASTHGHTIDLAIAGADAFYSTSGHYDTGFWDPQWTKISDNRLKAITSTTSNDVVHVYAVNEDDKVYGIDADYNVGRWTTWGDVPGGAVGVTAITATSTS